jgi:hypothetical protein
MKRYVIAAITCIALTVGVSPAAASGGLGGVVQTLTGTSQQNTNTAGDASAVNANGTSQSNGQSQTGYGGDASTGDASAGGAGCCGSGDATSGDAYGGDVDQSQEASNTNSTSQEATAESTAAQVLPVNVAVPICVGVYCKTGDVEQSNTNTSGDASAKNVNVTDQSNEQSQQGVGGDATTGDATTGGSGDATTGDARGGEVTQSQSASNANDTWQDASATSKAIQVAPVNVAVPVCIAAYCKTGDVEQSNDNRSGDASAFNGNGTWQSNEQGRSGYGGDASTGDATTGGKGCCSSGDATSGNAYGGDVDQSQSASNSNSTSQDAYAKSKAVQIAPVNVAVPVCVALSCRTGGVEQSNTNSSGDAWAGNLNDTGQSNEQWQKGVGGNATTGDATAGGECKPSEPYTPKHQPKPRCGSGDATSGNAYGGDVDQSQSASNSTSTSQEASAESKAVQVLPVNAAVPVCVALYCKTSDVDQSNGNSSGDAWAGNVNKTGQSNDQSQKGVGGDAATGDATASGGCCSKPYHPKPKHGCDNGKSKHEPEHGGDAESGKAKGGDVDQTQSASNDNRTGQTAHAASTAKQEGALNLLITPLWKPAPKACRPC